MIDVIRQQFREGMSVNQRLNLTREFLQILTLKIIDEKNFFNQIAFVGGTSLRILFDLRRFSEELDFSLTRSGQYSFPEIHEKLLKSFHLYGLPFEAKMRTEGTIHSMTMKFTGLLKEIGLSALVEQKLSIKFEVDVNPPPGWEITNTIVNKIYLFNIVHYDLPSLFASKLHACFYRKFTKGRDFYDLVWYLSKKIRPNFVLLNQAIEQTEGPGEKILEKNFKAFLLKHIQPVDFEKVKKDVERFLEDKSELRLFDSEVIQDTIAGNYP